MTTPLTMSLFEQANPLRLAGPLFDKELRVSSRQRRLYILRCVYVCLLLLVTVNLWLLHVRLPSTSSALVQMSRMAEAGKFVIMTVVWFQFVTGQFLATVLLSDAIGGEIRQRTLDALLVTPIGSVQIVLGKLFSKLLQLILLLAASLPLLALVRVFGGVPWDYVVAGLCVTLTTALFVGSLSLLVSIRGGQFQRVVTSVLAWCLLLWGGGAACFLSLSQAGYLSHTRAASILFLSNPYVLLLAETKSMLGASGGPGGLAWPLHCAVALGVTALVLLLAIWRVRRITIVSIMAQVEGRHGGARGEVPVRPGSGLWRRRRAIRHVTGSPIVWKERLRPWFRGGRRSVIYAGIALVLCVAALIALLLAGGRSFVVFLLPIQALQLAFVVAVATAAASAITREKEARTWPILLTTPLANREIARGKASGILRRCLWLLAPVPLLYLFFGFSAPLADINLMLVMLSVLRIVLGLVSAAAFLVGLGLYLSVRLRTTTAAVAATLGIYFGSKIFCCGFPLSMGAAFMMRRGGPGAYSMPFVQLLMSLGPAIVHVGLGVLFLRLATQRLRRNVFA